MSTDQEQPAAELEDQVPRTEDQQATVNEFQPKPVLTMPVGTDPAKMWPNADPGKGHVYGFKCPITGAIMVAMLAETWQNVDTSFRELQRVKVGLELDLRNMRSYALRQRQESQIAGRPTRIISDAQDPGQR